MPFDAPIMLGPFTVDAEGRLLPTDSGRFPAFSLRWRDYEVDVSLARPPREGDPHGLIVLRASVGRVPSTAGDAPGPALSRRSEVFGMLGGFPRLLPAGWRMELLADHSVGLSAEVALAMPATAITLVSEVTQFLLTAAPYLDLLAEAGLAAFGVAEPGTVKTWPG
jgi:hypothetical protein